MSDEIVGIDLGTTNSEIAVYRDGRPEGLTVTTHLCRGNFRSSWAAEGGYDFVAEVAPREGDVLLPKKHPSAFFGTPLASYLVGLGADTLVVTGCTTSGCVRGTVVDGFAYNFRVLVPHDCVYDRSAVSHAVNLFDMSEKYADVMSTGEAIERLNGLSQSETAGTRLRA